MKKLTEQKFIKKCIKIHGDKYSYKLVKYVNTYTKVKIVCPIHGIFEQTPNHHMNGQGCKQCGYKSIKEKQRYTTKHFIQKAKQIHDDKYDYSLVEYKNKETKVKIICPVHGVFEQIPNNHIRGSGCNKCGNELTKRKQTLDLSIIIFKAKQIHDNKYDYSLVEYIKKKNKIKIICPIHGEFEQRVENHLYGQGCPKCKHFISKNEIQLQQWLSKYIDIKCNDRTLIKPFELDIIIPNKKIAIEYNGLYWHSEQQGKDKHYHLNKYNLCKQQGYRLIQIWENEWLFKQNIVKSILLNAIGIHKEKIHGRKCIIKDVSVKEARPFYDNNHIQGFHGGKHKGLYYQNDLVSLMSIDKRGELQRFVNKCNTIVHGAFSKLLKSFNIDNIYTFADLRYFTGNVYQMNGFEYIYQIKPNYWYIKQMNVYHRRTFQKKNIQYKFENGVLQYFDSNKTEYENMLDNGYDRIWDCGNLKFEYKKTSNH